MNKFNLKLGMKILIGVLTSFIFLFGVDNLISINFQTNLLFGRIFNGSTNFFLFNVFTISAIIISVILAIKTFRE
jgi:hypothetical protein